MRLDRNTTSNRQGKYALVHLRKVEELKERAAGTLEYNRIHDAIRTLERQGILQWGYPGDLDEFFVIKLRDKYAQTTLRAYAKEAVEDDVEYADDVLEMAVRSGPAHPQCKRPD